MRIPHGNNSTKLSWRKYQDILASISTEHFFSLKLVETGGSYGAESIRMKRISAKLKEETVLRLLQGENINDLSRDTESTRCRRLSPGKPGLTHWSQGGSKGTVLQRPMAEKELEIAKKTIGELTMELNLHKKKEGNGSMRNGNS